MIRKNHIKRILRKQEGKDGKIKRRLKMIKRKRKRNPELQGIVKEILSEVDDWEYLSEGGYGEVYYFVIYEPIEINKTRLQPGEYVLKIEKLKLNDEQIQYLKELSKLELIPKIYYIDNKIQIMEYIEGKTLFQLIESGISKYNKRIIFNNVKKLISRWHQYKFGHGDLNSTNIIVNLKTKNVSFIDPRIYTDESSLSLAVSEIYPEWDDMDLNVLKEDWNL